MACSTRTEAAALGNVLVQAPALGAIRGSLDDLRTLIADTREIRRYEAPGDGAVWAAAELRVHG